MRKRMYTCMCDWVNLLDSRKLTEHYKPTIMEKIEIIKKKKKNLQEMKRVQVMVYLTPLTGHHMWRASA